MTANDPPEEVKRAAAIVDNWLKGQPGVLNTGTPAAPRPETAAEKFKRQRLAEQETSDGRGK
jgi:hypothetical protein